MTATHKSAAEKLKSNSAIVGNGVERFSAQTDILTNDSTQYVTFSTYNTHISSMERDPEWGLGMQYRTTPNATNANSTVNSK